MSENTELNTTVILSPRFDTSKQTQRNSASYAFVGANYVAPAVLYKSTNNHRNMDGNDNDDIQAYETPQKNAVLPLLVIKYTPKPHHNSSN